MDMNWEGVLKAMETIGAITFSLKKNQENSELAKCGTRKYSGEEIQEVFKGGVQESVVSIQGLQG